MQERADNELFLLDILRSLGLKNHCLSKIDLIFIGHPWGLNSGLFTCPILHCMILYNKLSAPRAIGLKHTFGSLSIHLHLLGDWVSGNETNIFNGNILKFLVFEESSICFRKILARTRGESINAVSLLEVCCLVSSNCVFRRPVIIVFQVWELFHMSFVHSRGLVFCSEVVVVTKVYVVLPYFVFIASASMSFDDVGVST